MKKFTIKKNNNSPLIILITILFLLLINLQYHLWFGKGGYQEYNNLKQMVKQQQEKNAKLKARNNMLEIEVIDLKQGMDAIEERARVELGMIKRGEVFYQIIE
ncbi:cell division protein FtsB [Candidatus Parabeggiatoa sp. HSG14]|uniref:cell division protein FtsB n=1 Tax=Candidatus Parabeggiatoa sp. HSG14 TaxID=3055593 RepID=UPI0025A8A1B2|nr:cell division protein FtsB [Thiotrichales bacterium HSG14]